MTPLGYSLIINNNEEILKCESKKMKACFFLLINIGWSKCLPGNKIFASWGKQFASEVAVVSPEFQLSQLPASLYRDLGREKRW